MAGERQRPTGRCTWREGAFCGDEENVYICLSCPEPFRLTGARPFTASQGLSLAVPSSEHIHRFGRATERPPLPRPAGKSRSQIYSWFVEASAAAPRLPAGAENQDWAPSAALPPPHPLRSSSPKSVSCSGRSVCLDGPDDGGCFRHLKALRGFPQRRSPSDGAAPPARKTGLSSRRSRRAWKRPPPAEPVAALSFCGLPSAPSQAARGAGGPWQAGSGGGLLVPQPERSRRGDPAGRTSTCSFRQGRPEGPPRPGATASEGRQRAEPPRTPFLAREAPRVGFSSRPAGLATRAELPSRPRATLNRPQPRGALPALPVHAPPSRQEPAPPEGGAAARGRS